MRRYNFIKIPGSGRTHRASPASYSNKGTTLQVGAIRGNQLQILFHRNLSRFNELKTSKSGVDLPGDFGPGIALAAENWADLGDARSSFYFSAANNLKSPNLELANINHGKLLTAISLHTTPLAYIKEAKVKDIQGGFLQEIQAAVLLPPRNFRMGGLPCMPSQNIISLRTCSSSLVN